MNNKPGKDLALTLLGLGMLGCGLFMFLGCIEVKMGYAFWGMFDGRFTSRGIGIFFIPMILGVILWVLFPKNMWPKVLFWVSLVGMIIYVISLFTPHLKRNTTLLEVIIYVLLIFIGGALSFKKLIMEDPKRGRDKE